MVININEWFSGSDAVDADLIAEKASLVGTARDRLVDSFLQLVFAREHKKISNYKEMALIEIKQGLSAQEIDQLVPVKNTFFADADSSYMKRRAQMLNIGEDDGAALIAVQNMAEIDFHIPPAENTEIEVWNYFECTACYLSVLHRVYAKLIPGRNYADVDGKKLQRIDFSLSKLLYEAGLVTARAVEQTLQLDLAHKGRAGSANKKDMMQKTARELYFAYFPEGHNPRHTSNEAVGEKVRGEWESKTLEGNENWKSVKAKYKGTKIPDEENAKRRMWVAQYGDKTPTVKSIKTYLIAEGLIEPK